MRAEEIRPTLVSARLQHWNKESDGRASLAIDFAGTDLCTRPGASELTMHARTVASVDGAFRESTLQCGAGWKIWTHDRQGDFFLIVSGHHYFEHGYSVAAELAVLDRVTKHIALIMPSAISSRGAYQTLCNSWSRS